MGLDYRHTCPTIDNSIKVYKEYIVDTLKDLIGELSPYIDVDNEDVKKLINKHRDYLYGNFEDAFEDVRSANKDMRKEADTQIDSAIDNLNDANTEINDLNNQIADLETQINELDTQLSAVS